MKVEIYENVKNIENNGLFYLIDFLTSFHSVLVFI